MPFVVAGRSLLPATLRKRYGDAPVLDLTSRGAEPWVRFSPFWPHGDIPIPFAPDQTGMSVEGIWQGLKVFEQADVDATRWAVTNMKGLKRLVRNYGQVLGHRAGPDGTRLLPYREARYTIYLPAYRWVLEHPLAELVEELRRLGLGQDVVLLDYETNTDPDNLAKPLSHAGLVKHYLDGTWPVPHE